MTPPTLPRFEAFGSAHLGALVLTTATGITLATLVRGRPGTGPLVRALLFVGIAFLLAFELGIARSAKQAERWAGTLR